MANSTGASRMAKPTNHTMLDYGLSKSKAGMKRELGYDSSVLQEQAPDVHVAFIVHKVVRVAADCPRSVVRRSRGLPCRNLGCHKPGVVPI
jgi:hypothetical protein